MQNDKHTADETENTQDPQQEQHTENQAEEGKLPESPTENNPLEKAEEEISELKDKYLRLYSEFENYRKRTNKERLDLLKSANQEMITALLPVVDDMERARQSFENANDIEALKEGLELVFNKLNNTLSNKGLKPMDAKGKDFDPELHEAITQAPAPEEGLKGKIIDEIEKGYYLHDKVIRFAKVIIGA